MKKLILLLFVIVFVSSCSLLKRQTKEETFDNFDTELRATFYVNCPVVEDTTLYTLVYYKYGNDTIHIYEKNKSIPKDTKYFKVIRVEHNVRCHPWY